MRHWLRLNLLALGYTLRGLVRHPGSSMLNLLVVGVTAAFPYGLYLLLASLGSVAGHMAVEPQLSIFLRAGASTAQVGEVKELLAADARVAHVRFVPRDEALRELQARTGSSDLLAGLTENPLPDAFFATARLDADAAGLAALQTLLARQPAVEEVQLDSAWAQRLERLLGVGRVALQVLALLLAVALALIAGNAIRMQILTRRDEIEVAKLIGATDAFIRRPFMYTAALQGLLGGALACAIVGVALDALNPAVGELAAAYGQRFALQLPRLIDAAVVCGTTVLLSLTGAWLAVWRHLRRFH
ncbi:permease-like cell division protein FtsX [Chitiniphilus purpureus]|uniref:Cell division protein FtsX n=1 Tax=Chitiniphilus purpureus TaxID=2981137 RepID=A0ABY6DP73_9NEIS|nr:permease-like cell division protein FtsX [Chitiniphilus sp. CD1]UXY16023.1 permease-like cell division protein FtsX [Chitiniphilus sp. CD1]